MLWWLRWASSSTRLGQPRMWMALVAGTLVVVACSRVAPGPWAYLDPDESKPVRAEPAEGDEAQAIQEWMARAQQLRGLRFLRPVSVRPLIRSEIADTIRAEIESLLPPSEVAAYRDAYVALGSLPPGIDLVATFSSIYGAQMVGRYSRREGALYLLESESPGGYARETVAVHELVHALQDQHFGAAMALSELLRHNDDLVSALAGVIEGDATFTMLGADDGDPATDRTLTAAQAFRDLMLRDLAAPTGALGAAPPLIRFSVIFPYAFGTVRAAERYLAAGNTGIDDLLADGPMSTLELFAQPDEVDQLEIEFVQLPLAELEQRVETEGCRLGHHNVAGSLTLRVLLEQYGAANEQSLERSWRGDRFVHVDCPVGDELVWLTRWRDEASAAAFERAYGTIAPEIARQSQLGGVPQALRSQRTVLVVTPRMRALADAVLRDSEVRSYRSFRRWYMEGCFGEGQGCPVGVEDLPQAAANLDSIR